jgi:prolyl oligopeptidase
VDHYTSTGAFVRTVALPRGGIGIGDIASSSTQARAIIGYSGWTGPVDRWVTYDATNGALATIYDVAPTSPAYANVRVSEIAAASKDGTRIPVTVLSLAGTKRDGTAPTILTGYGGFDIATTPRFIGTQLAWLQMGGVLAVANIRGGSEFGEAWHRHGMLTEKQHVFDDFYAAAQALVADRWTSTAHLGIEGGSNGGLLVGASLVQHPHEYRAVIGAAGLYDMIRSQRFPNGAYNVTEYGTTDDPTQFEALAAYSPYHHVVDGTAYPAVLLTTSENDPRVASWQSWKFGAALQHATTSGLPIVVLTRRSGGHGHGESFAQRTGNTAITLSFAAQQLGAHAPR